MTFLFRPSQLFRLSCLGGLTLLIAGGAACADPQRPFSSEQAITPEPERSEGRFEAVSQVLEGAQGRVSAVVMNTQSAVVYEHSALEHYELASIAKVYILVAYLDRLAQEQRDASEDELDQMRSMIEYSDNDSATSLFGVLGGADGINGFLQSKALTPLEPAWDGSWGSMRASPTQVGELLTRLYHGELLDRGSSAMALSMLANVIDEQSWGVGSADPLRDDIVYLKNGWLPQEEQGWIVHSIGIIAEKRQRYVLVFMSDGQPGFEDSVRMIETAVQRTREGLSLKQATRLPSPSPLAPTAVTSATELPPVPEPPLGP